MTRLAILSDVHGNLPALEAVTQDLAQFRVDQVIVAGDLVNVGPFPEQVVERIVESGWVVVRGSGELFPLDYGTPRAPDRWNDPTEFAMLPWLAHQVSDTWKQVIGHMTRHTHPSLPRCAASVHRTRLATQCNRGGSLEHV